MEGNNSISGDSHGGDSTSRAKRLKPTRDRLSDLPDLALTHILSHLYIEEAARTAILSKRFNSIWNSVPVLNFSDENAGKVGEFFISFVDIALKLHRRREIERFSVQFGYDFMFSSPVDDWIEFAVKKQVKFLYLDLIEKCGKNRVRFPIIEYKLPEFLYNNQNLVELVTNACKFSTVWLINWSSLKLLSVTRTKVDEELISRVLSGCPVLETLELREWIGFDKLKIESGSLRVLKIVEEKQPSYFVHPEDNCFLEVSGPNLVSLEVSGSLYRTKLRLTDVGCLSNATMNFEIMPQNHGPKNSRYVVRDQDIIREVLGSLCFVKALTIGALRYHPFCHASLSIIGRCLDVFIASNHLCLSSIDSTSRKYFCINIFLGAAVSTCEAYNLSFPWSERRSLTLCIPMLQWDHFGVASLLHSSPCLETLAIRLSYCSDTCALEHPFSNNCDEGYYWKSWSTISKCPLHHLKTVKVIGFLESCTSMKPLFQFLEFLLRNSSALLEIVIQASRYVTQGTIDEALKLLDVPTASPDVVVQYEPSHLWVDPFNVHQKSALV
ncbi:putative F-box protein At1g49610 [Chenopodium quinoa]|uniref:putative F-box protein At1g49610 n=1 Tax=Chenopodium quinoa TaxID=63459 RepID=UPI000B7808EC|nr:putative F-box protein At1g49610 [Chenopodium quinoa]